MPPFESLYGGQLTLLNLVDKNQIIKLSTDLIDKLNKEWEK